MDGLYYFKHLHCPLLHFIHDQKQRRKLLSLSLYDRSAFARCLDVKDAEARILCSKWGAHRVVPRAWSDFLRRGYVTLASFCNFPHKIYLFINGKKKRTKRRRTWLRHWEALPPGCHSACDIPAFVLLLPDLAVLNHVCICQLVLLIMYTAALWTKCGLNVYWMLTMNQVLYYHSIFKNCLLNFSYSSRVSLVIKAIS